MPAGISQGSWRVTLQGTDITQYCQESSYSVEDTLGQGPGVAAGASGRAKKSSLRTSLGPASSAIGAGQALASRNLLTPNQSNVETDTTGFSTTPSTLLTGNVQASMNRDVTTSWEESASLHFNTGAVSSGASGVEILPGVTIPAGSQVTISLYYKTTGSGGALRVWDYTNGSGPSGVSLSTPSASWQRVTYTFNQTSATADLRFCIRSSTANQDFWIDGLQVEIGGAATAWVQGKQQQVVLVRQGELQVFDSTNTRIFGGYITVITDQVGIKETGRQVIYTDIEAHDYWEDLGRVNVLSAVYDGQTDNFILRDLFTNYASNIDISLIPSSGGITLGVLNFKNKSLKDCAQLVADKYGYAIWIDADKKLHYVAPGGFSTAPFTLSTSPDFSASFQMGFDSITTDDTSAINRVTFYGGKQLSTDYTQDLSPLANGNTDVIALAYYPHKSSDGTFKVHVGGVSQVVGFYGSTGAANTLKKNGGSADVLINVDAHTLIFNTAPSNTGINSVTCTYRFEAPLVVQITDNNSVSFYGRILDGTIVDTNVFDTQTAVARCRALLNEQSMGLTTLKVRCWKTGITSGMLLRVDHDSRNIHDSFLVQEVDVKPLGNGQFEYAITAGAWHWNLVDLVMSTAQNATTTDDSANESEVATQIQDMAESVNVAVTWTTSTKATHNLVWGTSKWGLTSY